MTDGAWRTACATAVGTSHARTGAPCQDAARCEVVEAVGGTAVLLASVADGAGSAALSEQGAQLAVDLFHRTFATLAAERPDILTEAAARVWLGHLRDAIARLAGTGGTTPADYACTFLGAAVGVDSAAFLQIGDGAIVVDDGGAHRWVFWPQHGEYANSTSFVTDADAAERLQFASSGPVRELALFSDGLERLVLDMTARTVHSPSLRPIFAWLAGTPAGAAEPSAVLAAYLQSANVNRRTDDDKSLVMAVRAP